jgi:hypothetical protein
LKTFEVRMKLAVRYMGLVALLAMAPLAWASEPTDGERFRLRLHSTERYAIPGVGGGTMVRVEAPFLCITDAGAHAQPVTRSRVSLRPAGYLCPLATGGVDGSASLTRAVHKRADVDKARPDSQRLLAQLRGAGGEGCYLFSMEPHGDDLTAYARFFNPTVGLWEDSATGTAAGPLAAFLDTHRLVGTDRSIVIEQGRYMGRPSRLNVNLQDGVKLSGRGWS